MSVEVRVKLNDSPDKIIENSGINDNSRFFAAEEAVRLMDEYVPMKTGALADSAQVSVENGRGNVFYSVPYAAFCYYGGAKSFSQEKHQKASAFWDKAMTQVCGEDLAKSVENFIKSGRTGENSNEQ